MEGSTNFETLTFNPISHIALDNDSDPDKNFFNSINIDTNYHTPDNFKKINKNTTDDSFSVLHVNIRSIQTNFEKLKDLLHQLKFDFKLICITETWSNKDARSLFEKVISKVTDESVDECRRI